MIEMILTPLRYYQHGMHPPLHLEGVKKVFAGSGGSEIFILVGGVILLWRVNFVRWGVEQGWGGRVHVILKEKLNLHNASTKTIFGITNLIYFRDI